MKKTFSQEQLKEKAAKVFEQYPTAKQVFATVDGNIFLMKSRADLHSPKDKVYAFDRNDVLESKPKSDGKKNDDGKGKGADSKAQKGTDTKFTKATEIVAFIEKAEKLDDIKPYEADTRATVKAAYDQKVGELAKLIDVK